jgi:hypothetical protein
MGLLVPKFTAAPAYLAVDEVFDHAPHDLIGQKKSLLFNPFGEQ